MSISVFLLDFVPVNIFGGFFRLMNLKIWIGTLFLMKLNLCKLEDEVRAIDEMKLFGVLIGEDVPKF
jgi:hypothetical protein